MARLDLNANLVLLICNASVQFSTYHVILRVIIFPNGVLGLLNPVITITSLMFVIIVFKIRKFEGYLEVEPAVHTCTLYTPIPGKDRCSTRYDPWVHHIQAN